MIILRPLLTTLLAFSLLWSAALAVPPPREGEVSFEPTDKESTVAEIFHLEPHSFKFKQEFQKTASTAFEISLVTFPSPVVTKHHENNTVHCEYFRSLSPGKHPGVIVLHILGGTSICRDCSAATWPSMESRPSFSSCRITVRAGPRGSRCG